MLILWVVISESGITKEELAPTQPSFSLPGACSLAIAGVHSKRAPLNQGTLGFFPSKRSLQTKVLLPPRDIAPSGFRPLRKIPHCCLPKESGPCLSPNVAGHPLKPATDRGLGEPLPPQLANRTQAHSQAGSFHLSTYEVLANVSVSYPSPEGRFSRVTHPSATKACTFVRLACVRHAASVHPEPGSNSPLLYLYEDFENRQKKNSVGNARFGFFQKRLVNVQTFRGLREDFLQPYPLFLPPFCFG